MPDLLRILTTKMGKKLTAFVTGVNHAMTHLEANDSTDKLSRHSSGCADSGTSRTDGHRNLHLNSWDDRVTMLNRDQTSAALRPIISFPGLGKTSHIKTAKVAGATSLRQIAAKWNEQHIHTIRVGYWLAAQGRTTVSLAVAVMRKAKEVQIEGGVIVIIPD